MKTPEQKATLHYRKTHCKYCTEDMPEGKPDRACKHCTKLEANQDSEGLSARRQFITSAREAKIRTDLEARRLQATKEVRVTTNHVHLDLAEGARTIERNPQTGDVHVQVFGGFTKLEAMAMAIMSGPIAEAMKDHLETGTSIPSMVCELAQATLDECAKRGGWYQEPVVDTATES